MNPVPITSCAQCPTCRTYVPVPSNLLTNSNSTHISQSISPVVVSHQVSSEPIHVAPIPKTTARVSVAKHTPFTHEPDISYIEPYNPVQPRPPINPPVATGNYYTSEHENSWRSKFWRIPVFILGGIELVFTIIIIILEIASLAISTYGSTGAGIWCSISFMIAAVLTIYLIWQRNASRVWATYTLIAQFVLIIFCFILIGIDGSFISSNSTLVSYYSAVYSYTGTYGTDFPKKYSIIQAQLAFAILLLFSGFAYVIIYAIITYVALWKPYGTLDTSHLFRQ